MKMEQEQKQETITVGRPDTSTIICLSSASLSSDSHLIQKGEMIELLDHGCYHNKQKPMAD